jgi:hypothetical protein
MLDMSLSASLQKIPKSHQIAVDVCLWVIDGIPYSSLSREMDDEIRLLPLKNRSHFRTISNVGVHKPKGAISAKQIQPAFLQTHIVVCVEVVQPDYIVTALQQTEGDVHSDEAGGTC